jgi:hypothetical protein
MEKECGKVAGFRRLPGRPPGQHWIERAQSLGKCERGLCFTLVGAWATMFVLGRWC